MARSRLVPFSSASFAVCREQRIYIVTFKMYGLIYFG